jgi:hypothetical protein
MALRLFHERLIGHDIIQVALTKMVSLLTGYEILRRKFHLIQFVRQSKRFVQPRRPTPNSRRQQGRSSDAKSENAKEFPVPRNLIHGI